MRFPVAILLPAVLLAGCAAGSAPDRNFRSQVSEVDIGLDGNYGDARTGQSASGGANVKVFLRDPAKEGLAK